VALLGYVFIQMVRMSKCFIWWSWYRKQLAVS